MTDYLIKAALIQALCYGIYLLFLRNENQYNFRRWYLLATAGMALLMPAVQISVPQGFLSTTSNAAIYLNQLMATLHLFSHHWSLSSEAFVSGRHDRSTRPDRPIDHHDKTPRPAPTDR